MTRVRKIVAIACIALAVVLGLVALADDPPLPEPVAAPAPPPHQDPELEAATGDYMEALRQAQERLAQSP